jgi:hypothetical protein
VTSWDAERVWNPRAEASADPGAGRGIGR